MDAFQDVKMLLVGDGSAFFSGQVYGGRLPPVSIEVVQMMVFWLWRAHANVIWVEPHVWPRVPGGATQKERHNSQTL